MLIAAIIFTTVVLVAVVARQHATRRHSAHSKDDTIGDDEDAEMSQPQTVTPEPDDSHTSMWAVLEKSGSVGALPRVQSPVSRALYSVGDDDNDEVAGDAGCDATFSGTDSMITAAPYQRPDEVLTLEWESEAPHVDYESHL